MLFASLIREGWRVKPRFAPEEKRFLVQLSKDDLDSKGPAPVDMEDGVSELGEKKCENYVLNFSIQQ